MALSVPALTPLIKRIIIANAAIFLVGFIWASFSYSTWRPVEDFFAVSPRLWREWFPLVPVWQVATYGFFHSTSDLMHVLFNMLVLYFLGTMLEGIVGARRFLPLYLVGIVAGGVGTLLTSLAMGESHPTVGASAGVMAVVVACATLKPDTRIIFFFIPLTLKVFALIYVGLDLFGSIRQMSGSGGGVAHFAHLSGAAWGFAAVRLGWIWRDPVQWIEEQRETRAKEQKDSDDEKIDELLERIHKQGIHSLSERERAFLKRVSKRRSG